MTVRLHRPRATSSEPTEPALTRPCPQTARTWARAKVTAGTVCTTGRSTTDTSNGRRQPSATYVCVAAWLRLPAWFSVTLVRGLARHSRVHPDVCTHPCSGSGVSLSIRRRDHTYVIDIGHDRHHRSGLDALHRVCACTPGPHVRGLCGGLWRPPHVHVLDRRFKQRLHALQEKARRYRLTPERLPCARHLPVASKTAGEYAATKPQSRARAHCGNFQARFLIS